MRTRLSCSVGRVDLSDDRRIGAEVNDGGDRVINAARLYRSAKVLQVLATGGCPVALGRGRVILDLTSQVLKEWLGLLAHRLGVCHKHVSREFRDR